MAEPTDDDRRVLRAATPGVGAAFRRRRARADNAPAPWAPGRGWLEWSVVGSALALLFPVLALVGVGGALAAWRAGNERAVAALAAAVWCGMLGSGLRLLIGFPVLP